MELDTSRIVVDEVTLIGPRCGPSEGALHLLERGDATLAGLISAEYPLSDGLRAMEHASRRDTLKVLLFPGADSAALR